MHDLSFTAQEDLAVQGCYADNAVDPDLEYRVTIEDMTPSLCVEECRTERFLYSGLQVSVF